MSAENGPPLVRANATTVPQPPPLQIPDSFTDVALAAELAQRLAGRAADTGPVLSTRKIPGQVIWVDAGSEIMVYLNSTKTSIADGLLLVSTDFECDQTGRTPLIAAFAMNKGVDSAGLFATTDEFPRGNGILAARWGAIYQNAVWAALTSLVADHAAERKLFPLALVCTANVLHLRSGPRLDASQFSTKTGGTAA
ncbi:MAG TPA: hypothetical protein VNV86_16385 [Candidatus Acidoferrum sp.]|jgi:hypothetical protein|nr:hypothetical protein [Candidatus Acidoferrum sp.]